MKYKNNFIIKAAVVLAITLACVLPATATTRTAGTMQSTNQIHQSQTSPIKTLATTAIFEDDFESYEDFVLDFPPWTQYDGDGQQTWGFEEVEFTNEYYTGSYIIFNPSMTLPALENDSAHSGAKYAACFDAVPTDILNDDWLTTPQLSSGGIDFYASIRSVSHDSFWLGIDDFIITEIEPGVIKISFWAKTGSSEYEPDRFQVGISIKTNEPSSFKIISQNPYIEPPITWTEYSYTIVLEEMQLPDLLIAVKGGLGITASITNTGPTDATNCTVTFNISGGFILSPSGGIKTVTVGTIAADGGMETVKITVLGFGKPTITVHVTCDEGVTANSTYSPKFLLFFLVLPLPL